VQGTLNLLRACAKSGSMQTVVITSALACMMRRDGGEMSEQVFADPDIKELGGYGRSKVLAEKAGGLPFS
jgi:nucleoside-diphosphate-sugar epimerase